MKVLVIQIKMIGDVLASTVICEAIKREHPDWEVHYVIQKNAAAVVENNPYIDQIISIDLNDYKGFSGILNLGKKFKSGNYDAIIDVYGKPRTLLPVFLSGSKIRIGTSKWYSNLLLTKTIIPETDCEGTANAFRLLLAETLLDKKTTLSYPKIHLSNEEITIAKELISSQLDSNKKIFMIAVVGSNAIKSLPKEYMAKTLDVIANTNPEAQLVFNYMPDQENEAREIYQTCLKETQTKIVFDFYCKGLRPFLAVLSQCDALIGNEGGATNMAKALNIPTFTIYAPWINRNSWNIMETTGLHDIVHLRDYFPDLYENKHPKNFKKKSLEWYDKLNPVLFSEKLSQFVKRISQ